MQVLADTVSRYHRVLDRLGAEAPQSILQIVSAISSEREIGGRAKETAESLLPSAEPMGNTHFSITFAFSQFTGTIQNLVSKLRQRKWRHLTVSEGALIAGFLVLLIAIVRLVITLLPLILSLLALEEAPPSPVQSSPSPPVATRATLTIEEEPSTDSTMVAATETYSSQPSTQPLPSPDQNAGQANLPCLRAGTDFWYASWLPGDGPTSGQPRSRSAANLSCYDFESEGFSAISPTDSLGLGIRIQCGKQEWACLTHGKMRGVFLPLEAGDTKLIVQINEITIIEEGEPPNDVDLIIGVGDPFQGIGRFAIFRLVNPAGQIHLCVQSSPYVECSVVSRVELNDLGQRTVTISSGGMVSLSLDSESLGEIRATPESLSTRLWIGYYIKHQGTLDAIITFPAAYNDALSAP